MKLVSILALLFSLQANAADILVKPRPSPTPNAARKERIQSEDATSIRAARPLSITASALGKTPFGGVMADMNLIPYLGVGIGYGYFAVGNLDGSFIPLILQGYLLKSNFTPFFETGANFVTVTFDSKSSLLNSTFRGTQWILGAGLEYRFDFGLVTRVDAVRFMQAKIWSPGLSVGYSFAIE